jgi:hypothetical protein
LSCGEPSRSGLQSALVGGHDLFEKLAAFFSRCAFPDSEVRYQGCSGSFPNPEADRLSQLSTSTHNKCEQM